VFLPPFKLLSRFTGVLICRFLQFILLRNLTITFYFARNLIKMRGIQNWRLTVYRFVRGLPSKTIHIQCVFFLGWPKLHLLSPGFEFSRPFYINKIKTHAKATAFFGCRTRALKRKDCLNRLIVIKARFLIGRFTCPSIQLQSTQ